jgi:tetratricopeptide (TPR) repeat protein
VKDRSNPTPLEADRTGHFWTSPKMAIAKTGKLPRQNGTRQVTLPEGWWERLAFELKQKGIKIEEFCVKADISTKTLQRSRTSGLMSEKTLTALAVALDFHSTSNLLADWSEKPTRLPRSLSVSESADLERNYAALFSGGIYDNAAELASTTLARAEQSTEPSLMAHWADRTADAYRAMGVLRKASSYYARAWDHIQTALSITPNDVRLRYQAAKTRFGQIMVDDFLIRGAFREALDRHSHLLVEAQRLEEDADNEVLARDIRIRRTHIRRQQAEMLRLLGRYNEALSLIREVLADYPPSFYEERAYSRLSEADSLRLSGQPDAAVEIYEEL